MPTTHQFFLNPGQGINIQITDLDIECPYYTSCCQQSCIDSCAEDSDGSGCTCAQDRLMVITALLRNHTSVWGWGGRGQLQKCFFQWKFWHFLQKKTQKVFGASWDFHKSENNLLKKIDPYPLKISWKPFSDTTQIRSIPSPIYFIAPIFHPFGGGMACFLDNIEGVKWFMGYLSIDNLHGWENTKFCQTHACVSTKYRVFS